MNLYSGGLVGRKASLLFVSSFPASCCRKYALRGLTSCESFSAQNETWLNKSLTERPGGSDNVTLGLGGKELRIGNECSRRPCRRMASSEDARRAPRSQARRFLVSALAPEITTLRLVTRNLNCLFYW